MTCTRKESLTLENIPSSLIGRSIISSVSSVGLEQPPLKGLVIGSSPIRSAILKKKNRRVKFWPAKLNSEEIDILLNSDPVYAMTSLSLRAPISIDRAIKICLDFKDSKLFKEFKIEKEKKKGRQLAQE